MLLGVAVLKKTKQLPRSVHSEKYAAGSILSAGSLWSSGGCHAGSQSVGLGLEVRHPLDIIELIKNTMNVGIARHDLTTLHTAQSFPAVWHEVENRILRAGRSPSYRPPSTADLAVVEMHNKVQLMQLLIDNIRTPPSVSRDSKY
jgi:hypothetical protein